MFCPGGLRSSLTPFLAANSPMNMDNVKHPLENPIRAIVVALDSRGEGLYNKITKSYDSD
jgi:hypothetical protein